MQGQLECCPHRWRLELDVGLAPDPAWRRHAGTATARLEEGHRARRDLGLGLEVWEGRSLEHDLLGAHLHVGRADDGAARLAVPDDAPVLDLDPAPQVVCEAELVAVAHLFEVVGVDDIGQRRVVVTDPHLERHLRHSLDGF